jgi:hypothetical protein
MKSFCRTLEGSVALEVQFHHAVAKRVLGLPALAFQADSSAEIAPSFSAPPAAHPPAEKIVQLFYSFAWHANESKERSCGMWMYVVCRC